MTTSTLGLLLPLGLGTTPWACVLSVVNEQTESHKGFIFYLHEAELLYNDVHHSQLTL